jgi:hypothetical protein
MAGKCHWNLSIREAAVETVVDFVAAAVVVVTNAGHGDDAIVDNCYLILVDADYCISYYCN